MTKAISINIGLNGVNPACYNGWDGALNACVNDANSMKAIADSLGYLTIPILDQEATADRVIGEIGQAAYNLDENGILLLTYSGHGGQFPDSTGQEADGKNETWVLYDRQVIDDELYCLWNKFAAGARIFVLSDSCHSGTVTRELQYADIAKSSSMSKHYRTTAGKPRFRYMPPEICSANYQANKGHYKALQLAARSRKRDMLESTVVLISGCQDNQLSSDGDVNGLFTGNLLNAWNDGSFTGCYSEFHQAILDQMPATQTPNYFVVGAPNQDFEAQSPFAIEPRGMSSTMGSSSAWPTVSAPMTTTRNSPPVFKVNQGQGRSYALEIAADAMLFDSAGHAAERQENNFFATWQTMSFLQSPTFSLPSAAWNKLRSNNQLYYRILSNDNSQHWGNWKSSDANGTAPCIKVAG